MGNYVLITGGGHAEVPLIDALHDLGYSVVSTGLNKEGLGHRAADAYELADYSNEETMLQLANKYDICGVVAGCNDFAYLSAAYVAEQLGLSGHDGTETAISIHRKNRFRELQKRCGIRHPHFAVCDTNGMPVIREQFQLPVVVKPVDLTGGKGVEVCFTWEEVEHQLAEAAHLSRQSQLIVEEYIEGGNHGASLLLKNGKVVFAFFDNEEYFKNKYLVSGAYSPSDLSDAERSDIISQVEALARFGGLCDGLFHCQVISTEDGTPYLIDPCRRAPGDLYVRLVSYATGIDYPKAIVKSELGLPIDDELNFHRVDRYIARECMMTDANGIIRKISIDPDYQDHIIEKVQWLYPGDRIDNYLTYKAGIVFFEYEDPNELKACMKDLFAHMRIDVYA